MNLKKLAAIDIGSNGVRLLISNVIEQKNQPALFRKCSLVRVPIRLGNDVFLHKRVFDGNKSHLINTMKAYKSLMEVHGVERFRACATSAMREASNSLEIQNEVREMSGIHIDIIDGAEEAKIIADNRISVFADNNRDLLYTDVGGGSTEFTLYQNGIVTASKSFRIGTVRLLNNMVPDTCWDEMQDWLKSCTGSSKDIALVGSGGNINKIFKVSRQKQNEPLTFDFIEDYYKALISYSYEERIRIMELNPDRADVIVHAAKIFLNAMMWSGAEHVYVPKMGLSDGIIRDIYFSGK